MLNSYDLCINDKELHQFIHVSHDLKSFVIHHMIQISGLKNHIESCILNFKIVQN